jgi:hypothetical protein
VPCELELHGQVAAISVRCAAQFEEPPRPAQPTRPAQGGQPAQAAQGAQPAYWRNLNDTERSRLLRVLQTREPFFPAATENAADPQESIAADQQESIAADLEELKGELAAEAIAAFRSADRTVTRLTFRPGSIEVVAVVATTAKVISDFGSIAAGLRALRDSVPGRVREWLNYHATRILGRPVRMTVPPTASKCRCVPL